MFERYGRNGGLFIGTGVAYHKTGLHGILFISTVDCLHGLLFIHRRPPPASTCDCSSTAPVHPASTSYCSTSPLHGVLFNHPSTGSCSSSPPPATVQPALHRLLFNQPSTGSCSSSPPRGLVHPPARSIGVLFIQRQRPLLPRVPIHPTPHRELFIQTTSTTLTVDTSPTYL